MSEGLCLTELLQHHAHSESTGVFFVKQPRNESGYIYLTSGVVTHAETPSKIGLEAFFEILSWKEPQFTWTQETNASFVSMSSHVDELLTEFVHRQNRMPSKRRTRKLTGSNGTIHLITFSISSRELSPIRQVLNAKQITIGRTTDNELCIPDSSVSRRHALVCVTEQGLLVRDLGSTNGTRINGKPITQALLKDGQTLSLGEAHCVLKITKIPKPSEEPV